RPKGFLQGGHLLPFGSSALEYLTELTHRRPRIWVGDVDRLHALLATFGDDAMRAAFARGLAEQAIGAEYIAHYLAGMVMTPRPIEDSAGHPTSRSSFLGHPGGSVSSGDDQLSLDLPS